MKKHLFQNICLNNFFKDKEGNYWFATDTQGVIIVPSMDIIKINPPDDITSIYSITPDLERKHLFIGQNEGLISIVDNKTGKVIHNISLPATSGRVAKILLKDKIFLGLTMAYFIKIKYLQQNITEL